MKQTIRLVCDMCNKEFDRKISDYKRDRKRCFCSKECQNNYRVGENNPCWRGGLDKKQCVVCGELFDVPKNKDADRRKTCSIECRNVYISEWQKKYCWMIGLSSELHPNWNGGTSFEEYPKEFKDIRTHIKERDCFKCIECNSTEKLHVHHIDYDKKNNKENNLITLCIHCHLKTNFNRDVWKERYEKYALQFK